MATSESVPNFTLRQLSLPNLCPVANAVKTLSNASIEERGAIFTRREVVDFILDLAGYTTDQPLHTLRLLEPAFGDGDFLLPAVERLIGAWKVAKDPGDPVGSLSQSLQAVELHRAPSTEPKRN